RRAASGGVAPLTRVNSNGRTASAAAFAQSEDKRMKSIIRSTWRGNSLRITLALLAAALLGGCLPSRQNHIEPSPTMNTERNKATARRWSEELWSRGNLAVASEIISPDYVRHDAGDPFPARGPEDVKRIVTMLRSMLPDLTITVDEIVAEGDFVVSRY